MKKQTTKNQKPVSNSVKTMKTSEYIANCRGAVGPEQPDPKSDRAKRMYANGNGCTLDNIVAGLGVHPDRLAEWLGITIDPDTRDTLLRLLRTPGMRELGSPKRI